jgi:hypothetical protein
LSWMRSSVEKQGRPQAECSLAASSVGFNTWSGSNACFHSLTLEQSSMDDPRSAALHGRCVFYITNEKQLIQCSLLLSVLYMFQAQFHECWICRDPEDGGSSSKTSTIYQPTWWYILEEWHVKVLTQDWDLIFTLIFKTEDWHMPNIAAYTHFLVMYRWFKCVKFSFELHVK